MKNPNVVWHTGEVNRADRAASRGHRGVTLWFTGLSGSGKSTVAYRVERRLFERGVVAYVLDGDNLRHGLNAGLSFSPEDRAENVRRIGEVARLFTDAGVICLAAFVSPYRCDRDAVRARLDARDFVEIYVSTPLAICESRDPKGLYEKARAGTIKDFTGVNAPYEAPLAPELEIDTSINDVDASAELVLRYLEVNSYITSC